MPDDVRLPSNLQTALLGVLIYDRTYGATVADIVKPAHFDPSHRPLAEAVLRYRRDYAQPPGTAHVRDVARDAKQVSPRLLADLEAEAGTLNAKYIASRAADFVRRQVLKAALMEGGERYTGGEENLVEDVETILNKALRFRAKTFEVGIRLNDPKRALSFMEAKQDFYSLGIPELDRLGIGPRLGEMLLYIAPKGSGKSWFCVHCGRHMLLQGATVLHISLEMSEPLVIQRYYQNLFAIARRPDRVMRTILEKDKLNRLVDFSSRYAPPKTTFQQPGIRKLLRTQQSDWSDRLGRLIVKAFPTGQLTYEELVNYLDYLESAENFRPTGLIVDYPDRMALGTANYRLDLNVLYERLRGLGVERNFALITPTQGNRSSLSAKSVRSDMASEGMGKVNDADNVLTYSRTKAEARLNLARLGVAHARNEEGGSVIILTQSYATGQYVLDSIRQDNVYWDKMKEVGKEDDDEEE